MAYQQIDLIARAQIQMTHVPVATPLVLYGELPNEAAAI